MAYDTNLLFRLQALSTDTLPIDKVDSIALTTTGTVALVDVAGQTAWNFAPTATASKPTVSYSLNPNVTGGGLTLVVRYRYNNRGADNFDEIVKVAGANGAVLDMEKNGRANIIFRAISNAGGVNIPEGGVAGNIITLVCRITIGDGNAFEHNHIWVGGLTRTGDDPNYIGGSWFIDTSRDVSSMLLQALGTMDIDIFDCVLYGEEKTNAECAQLADNLRTVLPASGAPAVTPIAFTGTIPTQSFTAGDVVSVDLSTYFSGTETPFSFANTGTALTGSGLTLSSAGLLSGTATESSITGVIVTGTDVATNTAASNAFNITVAAAPSGVSSSAAITWPMFSVSGSQTFALAATDAVFTSEPLKDNTGALLLSAALDYVALYDNATGALVLRVTGLSTNASGVFSVENAALTAGVTYKVDWKVTSQAMGRMPAKAAV